MISIIIPAYNVQDYIEETIKSACVTADDNTEIIVINDGSTDNTLKVIENVKTVYTGNDIRVINQSNQGVSVARNNGIEAAEGDYLIFCDGDDRCKPDLINELREHMQNSDPDMVLWGFDSYKSSTGEYTQIQDQFIGDIKDGRSAFISILFGKNKIRLGSFAVKRSYIDDYDIRYTVGCPLSQDVEFMYKCLSRAEMVSVINKSLFTYVKRDGSVMFRYNINRFEAPRTMKRIYEYVRENTDFCNDKEIDEYLHNGFFLQHLIYSFDACIPYLSDKDNKKRFWNDYYSKYQDIEDELKRIKKDIQRYPINYKKSRSRLLLLSRKAYVSLVKLRKK